LGFEKGKLFVAFLGLGEWGKRNNFGVGNAAFFVGCRGNSSSTAELRIWGSGGREFHLVWRKSTTPKSIDRIGLLKGETPY